MALRRGPDHVTLRRKSPLPVWVQIGWRVALVLGLLVFAVLVHWLERDGLRDNLDNHVSFLDVIYFTMISITTTGYGDVVPIADNTRMFDALVVTPIRVFFVLIFIGTAYNFVFRRTWERWQMARLQSRLSGHIVVAGFGTSSSEAVDELIARGTPAAEIVVIDAEPVALERAESLGCAVLCADATRDTTLKDVHIDRAKAMMISAGRDDTSILMVLTARHLAPRIPISVAVRNQDNELLARQAGATTVINPVSFAGLLLAGSTHGEHIADYLADLASSSGRVQLHERNVTPEECGKPISAIANGLGVRLYRDGKPYGFWEPEAQSLVPGDCIIEILPTAPAERDVEDQGATP
ncbi:potassium channel family protein [Sphingosinicella sp. LHD-64]|uniref:potassium channel family protein n=1 Tax=Sphingosinicella sp. LHD-64 TaxID=3072139 RepID=UPI00280E4733|nr:potassium channel family protein [Sphingosinicella sp. LHD-64]MDQ8755622.1 potassium channel family protein [Sphingosinicella sp. LHD-64]